MKQLVVALLFASLGALVGCFASEDLEEDRMGPQMDAFGFLPDGGGPTEEPCPEGRPKSGEACPLGFGEDRRCVYENGQCTSGPSTYDDTITFCCISGYWATCGESTICDRLSGVDAGPIDAPPGG